MITNFKIYENKQTNPRLGDYVICSYDDCSYEDMNMHGYSLDEKTFIRDKIGKVIKIDRYNDYPYYVSYDNIPEHLSNGDIDGEDFIYISRDAVKYWSKDKKELDMILNTKKFNI